MYYDQTDPYGGGYYDPYDPGGTTTDPTGTTGTSTTRPPPKLGGHGWWVLVGGVWRWVTEPISRTISP